MLTRPQRKFHGLGLRQAWRLALRAASLLLVAGWLLAGNAFATTINWGSTLGQTMVDSHNQPLTGAYSFQLGAFIGGFVPTAANQPQWSAYWRVFDQAVFTNTVYDDNGVLIPNVSIFTGTAELLTNGTSSSSAATAGANFFGLSAYLWVYNTQDLSSPPIEWFLGRSPTWTFPTQAQVLAETTQCCGGALPVSWSTSELPGPTIQTSDIPSVPEPNAAWVVLGLLGLGSLLRKRGEILRFLKPVLTGVSPKPPGRETSC